MSKRAGVDDGGSAFPVPGCAGPMITTEGMSLRDYLAGQALTGMLANPTRQEPVGKQVIAFTNDAYLYADAMLAERWKTK